MATRVITPSAASSFAADVRAGLTREGQKQLPSKYLYDTVGSKLFDVISELPEYGLTRADERLLQAYAAEMVARIPGDVMLCELGSGSGRKTRWILQALAARRHTRYFPIEISAAALAVCRRELADIDPAEIVGLEREYLDGLTEAAALRRRGQRILVLFLGSTIGNFSHPEDVQFLREIRWILDHGDALLLGTDLEKPIPQLIAAYDDSLGITAAFNLNLLARINRELGGNFVLGQFKHVARFNQETHSVEMHIQSTRKQAIEVRELDLTVRFEKGETICTENIHKYGLEEPAALARKAGFRCEAQWIDQEWPFAESLLIAE